MNAVLYPVATSTLASAPVSHPVDIAAAGQ